MFFRSECLALAMLGTPLPALQCVVRLENKGFWQHGKQDEGQAQPLLVPTFAEDCAGGPSPALCPSPGDLGCWGGHIHATGGWLLILLLAWASSHGSG